MPAGRQEPSHDGFVAVDLPYDCAQCIRAHAGRVNAHMEAEVFPPTLDPANHLAWTLFQQIEDQVRVGMEVVGLDYGVLPAVFDLYGVPQAERRLLFEKVVVLNRARQHDRARTKQREHSAKMAAQNDRVARGV